MRDAACLPVMWPSSGREGEERTACDGAHSFEGAKSLIPNLERGQGLDTSVQARDHRGRPANRFLMTLSRPADEPFSTGSQVLRLLPRAPPRDYYGSASL